MQLVFASTESDLFSMGKGFLPTNVGIAVHEVIMVVMPVRFGKIIAKLKEKFPNIIGPEAGDLCYATGNRQAAVLDLCSQVDLLLVVGAKNSSNSSRLMELGLEQGIKSHLIESVHDLDPEWFQGVETVGLSSGASAPEILVQEVVDWIKAKYTPVEVENFVKLVESTKFNLPKELQDTPQS